MLTEGRYIILTVTGTVWPPTIAARLSSFRAVLAFAPFVLSLLENRSPITETGQQERVLIARASWSDASLF